MKIAALVLLCTMASCAHGSTTEVAVKALNAKEFYPLAVGNLWTYDVNLLGEKRSIDVTLLGLDAEGFMKGSNGTRLLVDSYGVRDDKRYLLREPIEAGTKWTNVVSVSSVEHYVIISADQPCDTPAQTFASCVVVEGTNQVEPGKTLMNEMTFARGVGLVKVSTVLEAGNKRIPQLTLQLTKYTPAKSP